MFFSFFGVLLDGFVMEFSTIGWGRRRGGRYDSFWSVCVYHTTEILRYLDMILQPRDSKSVHDTTR
jgi:hypothetical protein